MNRTIFRTAGSILAGIVLTGCETYKPYSNPAAPLPTLKWVAIVMPLNSKEKRRRADDISNVLAKRGIEAVIVPESDPIPKDVDGYFTYTDSWQWDLTMYLADIEIKLHDAQTGKVLREAKAVTAGQSLKTRLKRGELFSRVEP